MTHVLASLLALQIQFVVPERYEVTHGVELQGGVRRVQFSDDDRLIVEARRPLAVAEPSAQVVFEATSPSETPQTISLEVEALCTGEPALQRIELFNFTSGQWEIVDERPAPSFDKIVSVQGNAPPADYVEDGTRRLRVRVGYHDRGVTFISWTGQYDRLLWGIVP